MKIGPILSITIIKINLNYENWSYINYYYYYNEL